MNKKLKLFVIAVPILLVIQIAILLTCCPSLVGLPKLSELGSGPELSVIAKHGADYVFAVAKRRDIEGEWRGIAQSVRYRLEGDSGSHAVPYVGLMYSSDSGEGVHAVSVFSYVQFSGDDVPIKLISNIDAMDGCFWVYTTGSYLGFVCWSVTLFILNCGLGFLVVNRIGQRGRAKGTCLDSRQVKLFSARIK